MSIVKIDSNDNTEFKSATEELGVYFSSLAAKKGRKITYNVLTYGCQLNESDSEKLEGMLMSFGLTHTEEEGELAKADVILMNTCSVRENADKHLFGNLGVFKSSVKQDKDTIVIICGCMMKVEENVERIRRSYPYVDLVFDPQQIHRFPVLLRDSLRKSKQLVNIGAIDYIAEDDYFPIARQRKFRALVPIMYGCNNFCTYCIVPYARGRERSRNFDNIVIELKDLYSRGYKEVMLLGQNVNSYGLNNEDGKTFKDVLEAASDIGFNRVRFMSSHPKDLSDEVIDLMATRPNIEKHLHLAMQSGSNKVLKRMNRPYSIEQFLDIASKFRSKVEGGSLTTDIIVGFPGETEEDFCETLKAVEKAAFDAAFTFQYSIRPGTKAAAYEDQIPKDVVTERFDRLLKIQNDLAFKSNEDKVGKTFEVLIEGMSKAGKGTYTGRTLSNHLVNFTIPEDIMPQDEDLEGRLGIVRIDHARPYSIDGVLERFSDV
ncbi:MAG: tRNA (N6-isopentenyl adenosine(37)-C2)-methylthiotransferase MiaB [Saccharofermentans sp.]|nr:tRNA (N6-isopentenyl adenosine(37)-C2)-methylthiotransferase MiaB [Saccharofermentans sp.]